MRISEGIIIKDMEAFIKTLTKEEIIGIRIFCRYKSFARENELKQEGIEKKSIMDSLVKKGVLGKNGFVTSLTYEIDDALQESNIYHKIIMGRQERKEVAPISDLKARVKDLL